jgi:hypothetical protein
MRSSGLQAALKAKSLALPVIAEEIEYGEMLSASDSLQFQLLQP